MSPDSINATTSIPEEFTLTRETEEESQNSREERKATGRSIAIVIFLSVMSLALYHVVQQKTTILAGVLVPALILFTYLFFVIHISSKEKEKKRNQLEHVDEEEPIETVLPKEHVKPELQKKVSNLSIPSTSPMPSTSGLSNSSRHVLKQSSLKSSSHAKTDSTKKPKPFIKAPSQSHIQVKNASILVIEHERKKLKKSKSFDKANNFLEPKKIKI